MGYVLVIFGALVALNVVVGTKVSNLLYDDVEEKGEVKITNVESVKEDSKTRELKPVD